MATTKITATCACHAFNIDVDLPNSSLPIQRALCLCNTCRRVTGSCGVSTIPIPHTKVIEPSKYGLTAYITSEDYTRYFCSTCGAHVLLSVTKDGTWHLASGLADRTEGIVLWKGSEWVEDTLDGGISVWLREGKDSDGQKVPLKRWLVDDFKEKVVPEGELEILPASKTKSLGERLKAQCHCGGVRFHITRPSEAGEASKEVASPFSDLIVPYKSGASAANPHNEQWWLRANGTKYFAGTCTCTSCRVASGFEIQPWAFVPKCNIIQENGKPIDFHMGTMKTYPSSEGVWREFCGVCGATIFWHCAERPLLIDVSVGVLDPDEGARAENWLDWCKERVSFRELSVSETLVASLEAGLAAS